MTAPIVQIEELGLTLSGSPILNGISLSVTAGEYVSIVGPNGAGKTSLIKCLAGIHTNWSGAIRINGKHFAEHSPKELAKIRSYVPQAEGRYFPLTVEEFTALGRYPHLSPFTTLSTADHQTIDSVLELAGLSSLRRRAMSTLSGGERQMAFIAAALVQESRILLLDEPATFLDYRHQADVSDLLTKTCRTNGITVIAVHHDINTALACSDRIHALKNGRLLFSGTPEETAGGNMLESIYETPFMRIPSPHSPLPFISPGGAP
ncbi:MAG: ABC transporter ATP-binding protein [Pontiellaceae bacterium]|nr:ABC transporter ATP-binding protein [Pontiellaceae bacterium]MBN2784777.1 ABC transporter ATP-binding protein [Pontiellaceae bacterium]